MVQRARLLTGHIWPVGSQRVKQWYSENSSPSKIFNEQNNGCVHGVFFNLNPYIFLGRSLKTTTSIDQVQGVPILFAEREPRVDYWPELHKEGGYPAKCLFFDYLNSYSHSPPE